MEPFTKLAVEKGWAHERTERAIYMAVRRSLRAGGNDISSDGLGGGDARCDGIDESSCKDGGAERTGNADLFASVAESTREHEQQQPPSAMQMNEDEDDDTSDRATKRQKLEMPSLQGC